MKLLRLVVAGALVGTVSAGAVGGGFALALARREIPTLPDPSQLRTQRTAPLHNLPRKPLVHLSRPISILPAPAQNHAPAVGPRKHVGDGGIHAVRTPQVHARDGDFWLGDEDCLAA